MAREGKAYLTELVESVICVPDALELDVEMIISFFPFSPKIRKPFLKNTVRSLLTMLPSIRRTMYSSCLRSAVGLSS